MTKTYFNLSRRSTKKSNHHLTTSLATVRIRSIMLRITGRKSQLNASRIRINATWPFIWKDDEDEEHPPPCEDHPKARVPIAAIKTQEKATHMAKRYKQKNNLPRLP